MQKKELESSHARIFIYNAFHQAYKVKVRRMALQAALKTVPLSLAWPVVIRPDLTHGFPDVTNMADLETRKNFLRQILDVFLVDVW
jgi:hypothetical protein